jgi:anti-anti-sigma regulatory factor
MLRLTTIEDPSGRTIRAEGELVADWVRLLAEACDGLREPRTEIRLDLSGLTYVDTTGVDRLRALEQAGVRLLHCPPLIRTMVTED